ncbi:MAG: hypothetical protein ACLQAT_11260 [Candidatus Binataceae bacterium]
MASLVSRPDVRDENRKVLRIILGVMVFLVMVSIATIVLKHRG